VRLVTAAVVRLVRTLAHDFSPMVRDGSRRCFGQIARLASDGADRNPQDSGTAAQGFCGFGRHRPPTYSRLRARARPRREHGHAAPVDTG
jgi:hypothetical protein